MIIEVDDTTIEIVEDDDGYFVANAKTVDGKDVTSCEGFVTESELIQALKTIDPDDFWQDV